ncbi:MAG: hypothetical protein NG747_06545 [Candidatus Brocadia sp.]|nr:hypothetical protein [Candidatus Brocadia sp.]
MMYRYSIFVIAVIFTLIFCQTTFSDTIRVGYDSRIPDVNNSGTATVKILSDNGNSLNNVNVVSNIAPCGIASSSGGGVDDFGPGVMNDGIEKADCSYHWIRTRNEIGQRKIAWIQLDWNKVVTVTGLTIQTTDCNGSCGEDSDDPLYIDPGRNLGSGIVQHLSADGTTWVTDAEFRDKVGDIEYSFTQPITTKAIRVRKISPSTKCQGQQSNPVVFEWKVYGTPFCK